MGCGFALRQLHFPTCPFLPFGREMSILCISHHFMLQMNKLFPTIVCGKWINCFNFCWFATVKSLPWVPEETLASEQLLEGINNLGCDQQFGVWEEHELLGTEVEWYGPDMVLSESCWNLVWKFNPRCELPEGGNLIWQCCLEVGLLWSRFGPNIYFLGSHLLKNHLSTDSYTAYAVVRFM